MPVIITTGRKEDPLSLLPFYMEDPMHSEPARKIIDSASELIRRAQRQRDEFFGDEFFIDKFQREAASQLTVLGLTAKRSVLLASCAVDEVVGAGFVCKLNQGDKKGGIYTGFRPLKPQDVIYFLNRVRRQ